MFTQKSTTSENQLGSQANNQSLSISELHSQITQKKQPFSMITPCGWPSHSYITQSFPLGMHNCKQQNQATLSHLNPKPQPSKATESFLLLPSVICQRDFVSKILITIFFPFRNSRSRINLEVDCVPILQDVL
jgi:hypothetical protein